MRRSIIPSPGIYASLEAWALALVHHLRQEEDAEAYELPTASTYVVANLPKAKKAGVIIYVPDEVGGATLAFSDGTDWRRAWDLTIVS